jgi:two-component system, OmpR family, alkaline phosphatase synthesis response regulator PhoP
MSEEVDSMDTNRSGTMSTDANVYDDGTLRIEYDSFLVTFNGRVLFLPRKEFLVLSALSRSMGRMVESESIWRHAWGDKTQFSSRTLRVHICNLRRKVEPMGLNIRNVSSVGYCLFWFHQQFIPSA